MPLKDSMAPIFITFQGYIYCIYSVLKKFKVHTLSWPAHSPDLNPIVNCSYMEKRVYSKGYFTNKDQLFIALQKELATTPKDLLGRLYWSIPLRMDLVCSKRGFPTRYCFAVSSACMPHLRSECFCPCMHCNPFSMF